MPNLLDLTFNIPHASLDTAKNLKCLNRRKNLKVYKTVNIKQIYKILTSRIIDRIFEMVLLNLQVKIYYTNFL